MLPQPVSVADLAARAPGAAVRGDGSIRVSSLCYNSPAVRQGSLFFCRPGAKLDGHNFAAAAVASGAVALVCERPLQGDAAAAAQIIVPSVHEAMGPMASFAYGDPSRAMRVVGITGTNGKTTTAFMLERCMIASGLVAGLLGTVETHIAGAVEPAGRTTPESVDLQQTLRRIADAGAGGVAMEVSSHGLALHRVTGTTFACAVFTNLTQDHLDFHESMEEYFGAKTLLFDPAFTNAAVVNAGDEYGRRLGDIARSRDMRVTTFSAESEHETGQAIEADITASNIRMDAGGSSFLATVRGVAHEVRIQLSGPFNIANALAAIGAADAIGIDVAAAAAGLAELPGVPGRLERVASPHPFTVLVDYAHTPDSVERVLRAVRATCDGKLTVVVGCGGDRDRSKRPLMGHAAAALADRAILTSDNPRSEDPLAILAEVESGARETGRAYEVEADRRAAIRAALHGAAKGDVIVIAGKGHESGQEFADRVIPFDDRVVAQEELARL